MDAFGAVEAQDSRPLTIVRRVARGVPDLRALGLPLHIPTAERDDWQAIISETSWGWEPVLAACRFLASQCPPGKRVYLSSVLEWLPQHYDLNNQTGTDS